MNTHVNFETAKLLKEKGFDKRAEKRYGTHTGILYNDAVINDLEDDVFTAAPTIDEVKWWLYEKHGIWISVDIDVWNTKLCDFAIVGGSDSYDNPYHYESDADFNSPTEAYQEAITYTLKNLI